jgi:hypothetical protein
VIGDLIFVIFRSGELSLPLPLYPFACGQSLARDKGVTEQSHAFLKITNLKSPITNNK